MPELPHFKVSGSNYAVGIQIGRKFSAWINRFCRNYELLQQKLLPYYHTAEGRKNVDFFLQVNRAAFPEYVRELEGIADGAEVPFAQLLLCNLRGEISGILDTAAHGCFDAVWRDQQNHDYILHNEDGVAAAFGSCCLITATIPDRPAWNCFSYPGMLCGNAFGANSAGMAHSIDNVKPCRIAPGLGRHFIARSLLDSRSLEESAARAAISGGSSGFNYIIASVSEKKVIGLETSPSTHHRTEIVSLYFHTNHYISLPIPQRAGDDSRGRLQRALAFPKPKNLADLLQIGGCEDGAFPLYRRCGGSNEFCTLGTALFDLEARNMLVYYGVNPAQAAAATLTVKF